MNRSRSNMYNVNVRNGVRQSEVLSSILFTVHIDGLLNELRSDWLLLESSPCLLLLHRLPLSSALTVMLEICTLFVDRQNPACQINTRSSWPETETFQISGFHVVG